MRAILPLVVAAGAGSLGGCVSDGETPPRDAQPERPSVVDWKRGTYDSVRLGDRTNRLTDVLGEPEQRGTDLPVEPIGEDFYEIGGLTNYGSPDIPGGDGSDEELRYRHRVFVAIDDRITSLGTTYDGAQTPEGVGLGDDRSLVKRRYPRAACFTQNEGTEYATYPICRVRVCRGRVLGFGGDPIKSLWLAAETWTGMRRCERPTATRKP